MSEESKQSERTYVVSGKVENTGRKKISPACIGAGGKGRRNGFFESRIKSYRNVNMKLIISRIRIVT
jgi:hypothetical protein